MNELDESKKEKNLVLFFKRLESIGVDTRLLSEKYSAKLKDCPLGTTISTGLAYDGALLDKILRHFTPKALQILDTIDESIKPTKEQVMKVAFLHKIGLCNMFIKNTNEWEITNRGIKYTYAPSKVALKSGMRSILICQECNISLTEEEMEAMIILERNEDDSQAKFYSSPLAIIIKTANEIVNLENRLIKK